MRDFIDTATLSCLFIFLGIDYVRSMLLQEQEEGKEKKEREKGREIEISERQENEPPEKTEGERGGRGGAYERCFRSTSPLGDWFQQQITISFAPTHIHTPGLMTFTFATFHQNSPGKYANSITAQWEMTFLLINRTNLRRDTHWGAADLDSNDMIQPLL